MESCRPVAGLAAVAVVAVAVATGCTTDAGRPVAVAAGTTTPDASTSTAAAAPASVQGCNRHDLTARFAGGGMGTGNDFGSIVVWNHGPRACRVAGAVAFTALLRDGRRDAAARPNRHVPPVDVVLPANEAPFHDGEDPAGYLTADLMGPERDDPAQPDALCRRQDQIAPTLLLLTIGRLTFRVPNADQASPQVSQVYGCHGRVLLEGVERAA